MEMLGDKMDNITISKTKAVSIIIGFALLIAGLGATCGFYF